ncbi:MAG: phosphoribosyltransferase [Candidatus Heimdallarchaeota archaeon]
MTEEITVLYLDDIYNMLHNLTMKMDADGVTPDVIVGISRGGLVVSRLLSDILGINDVQIIGIDYYKGIDETKKAPKLTQDLTSDIKGKIVLLVDDVSDSGKSLELAVKHLKEKKPKKIVTATINYKPKSIFKPDYYMQETSDWIVYAWEWFEFSRLYYKKHTKLGKSADEIKAKLKQFNIPDIVILEVVK